MRLEETLGCLEPLASNPDHSAIRKRVGFHQNSSVLREPLVELQIVGDVAQLLLDLAHGLEVRRPVEGVAAAKEQSDQVPGDVATGDVKSSDVVVQDCGFVDGDDVRHTVTGVDNDTAAKT